MLTGSKIEDACFDMLKFATAFELLADTEDKSVRKLKTVREKHLAREREKVWRQAAKIITDNIDDTASKHQEDILGG